MSDSFIKATQTTALLAIMLACITMCEQGERRPRPRTTTVFDAADVVDELRTTNALLRAQSRSIYAIEWDTNFAAEHLWEIRLDVNTLEAKSDPNWPNIPSEEPR